jgi:CMP-2-keto-3-deoxyoctulosonic acid synthetase
MKVLKTEDFGIGVDVPSDIKKAEELMQKHALS